MLSDLPCVVEKKYSRSEFRNHFLKPLQNFAASSFLEAARGIVRRYRQDYQLESKMFKGPMPAGEIAAFQLGMLPAALVTLRVAPSPMPTRITPK